MKLVEHFAEFFERSGIQKKWFAERIGIEPKYFYQIVTGRFTLPKKYWAEVIEMTNGKISFADILEAHLNCPELVNVEGRGKKDACIVSLRKIDKLKND